MVTEEQIQTYEKDGAIILRNVFNEYQLQLIAKGIAHNLKNPSIYASENGVPSTQGRFFDDYCNWTRIPEFREFIYNSPASEIAAQIMRSNTCQFFHDHVLVKDPGTQKASPWHQDDPYYFVNGHQNVSMWIPIDPVEKESTLRFIAGSHKWTKMVKPVRWADDSDFYNEIPCSSQNDDDYNNNNDNNNNGQKNEPLWLPVPDPDNQKETQKYRILEWSMNPGDVALFHFRTVHGARGNFSTQNSRRVLSLRWLGDDIIYTERPGKTSPPFPGHGMQNGQRLRKDWFPIIPRTNES